ncbi:MAG TPA: hypothetical protein VIJ22_04935, partial [Polyangiaceae bacterium]
DDQKSRVAKLKAAIAASAPATGGAPREVRAAALSLKAELRQVGTTARVLATALGIHETTLCRWQQDEADPAPTAPAKRSQGRGAGFRMVQVAGTRSARVASVPASTTRGLRVAHAPSGLVIDGLDVDTLAALLQRMS